MESKIAKRLAQHQQSSFLSTEKENHEVVVGRHHRFHVCSPRSPCAAPPQSPTNRVNRRPNHSERYRYLGWKNSSVEDPTVSVLSTISYFIYRPVSSTFSVSSTCTSSEAHLPLRPSSQHLSTHHPINSQSPQSCRSKFPKPTTSWTFSA